MIKKIVGFIFVVIIGLGGYDYWHKQYNYNFGTITENKVYKSGAIEPSKINEYIKENNIKTVIDLRNTVKYQHLLDDEKRAVELSGAKYVNIRSPQIPNKKHLEEFFEVMDNKDNYPVLIHCYHGLGRTMLYVSLYRIEYENMDNEKARDLTRPYPVESFLHHSQFSSVKSKGKFLIDYVPRDQGDKATIHNMK